MPGFTVEPLPGMGAVRLVFDYTEFVEPDPDNPVGTSLVQMFRLTVPPDDPSWYDVAQKVRIRPTYELQGYAPQFGQSWEMFNEADVWYDVEAPLDTPLWYVIETIGGALPYWWGSPAVTLLAADFEAGITGWTADANGAVTWNQGSPLVGGGSLRVRASATAATAGGRHASVAVVAGRAYQFSAAVRSPTGGPWRFGVDWFTAGSGYLSTTYGPQTSTAANVTTRRSFSAVAPATAAFAQPRFTVAPATLDQIVIVDTVRMRSMGQPGTFAVIPDPVVLASNGGGWFTDPLRPARDVPLSLLPVDGCDVDELVDGTRSGVIFAAHAADTRASGSARFDIIDQPTPVAAIAVRKAPASTLTLASVSETDRDRVHLAVAAGDVNLLRLPAEFGVPYRYTDVGDVVTSALSEDLRLPYRVHDLPYVTSGPPTGPIEGVVGTRLQDLDRYPTWADFDAAALTSIDLLHGAGSTTGVQP